MPKRLASKFSPATLYGRTMADDLVDGIVQPKHFDRFYVESTFGVGASGILRQIQRLWVQDGKLFSEETDNF